MAAIFDDVEVFDSDLNLSVILTAALHDDRLRHAFRTHTARLETLLEESDQQVLVRPLIARATIYHVRSYAGKTAVTQLPAPIDMTDAFLCLQLRRIDENPNSYGTIVHQFRRDVPYSLNAFEIKQRIYEPKEARRFFDALLHKRRSE